MNRDLTDTQRDEIVQSIFAGQKINAIKLYRDATGEGLAEAKGFIEQLESALREERPERFQQTSKAGCGASALLLLLIPSALLWALFT